MKDKFKISICMMVKNEEKNLERCLNSLNLFLKDPSVELIIIDTGSEDNTIDIARRYTSKLYFHKWNNNFSEMRNISISYAKGEWIFIIDADEYLESPEEAYNILMNLDLKKYNTIQLQIKSYFNFDEGSNYSILPQPRIFRNDGTFKYKGTVHNQPKFKLPMLDTNIILGHYGYVTSDKELMEKKFQRTATILKKELERNPQNIYYQFQLAISYSMYGDYKTALREIRKAYELIKEKPLKEKKMYVYIHGMYGKTAFKNCKLAETIQICEEGIRLQPDFLDLHFILANALIKRGERSKAIGHFKKYTELLRNFDDLDISKHPAFTLYHIDSNSSSIANSHIAAYHFDNKEYEEAYKYLQKIEKDSYKIQLTCKILIKLERFTELKTYYDGLDDEDNMNKFIMTLENEIKELKDEKRNKIVSIFKSNDDEYGLFNRIRAAEEDNKVELIKEFFSNYDINKLPVFFGSILKELIQNKVLMFTYLKRINNTMLKQHIVFLINEFEEMKDYLYEFLNEFSNKIRSNDFQSNRVYSIIANAILLKAMEEAKSEKKPLEEKYTKIFNLYLEKGFNCLEYMYDMRKIRMIYSSLDTNETKFLMIMYLVEEAISRESFELAIKYIREALKEFPHMSIALQEYQKTAFKDINIE